MSAHVVVLQDEAIQILTDGARYDMTGILTHIEPKCHELTGPLRAALVRRGVSQVGLAVLQTIESSALGFDQLVLVFPQIVTECVEALRQAGMAAKYLDNYDFVLAGWSPLMERLEVHYLIGTPQLAATIGFEPDELVCLNDRSGWDRSLIMPMPPECPSILAGVTPATFDPVKHGVALMDAQRRFPPLVLDADLRTEPSYNIGGHCLLMTVTLDRITSRVLKRYPDRIGHRIDPGRDSLSRRERRAAESSRRR